MNNLIKIIKSHSFEQLSQKIIKRINLKIKYRINKVTIKYQKPNESFSGFSDYTTNMIFFFKYTDKYKIINFYEENPTKKLQILNEADRILDHEFEILGETIKTGKKINWHMDYYSGFSWEEKFYKDIEIINLKNDADVKKTWELSRFNHLFTLGKAFWITNNQSYYKEAKEQIQNWCKKNPYSKTVQWTNTMEVAIRAVNWIFMYFHFEEEIEKDKEFKALINNMLYLHGKYIFSNLENYSELRNNHYVANLTGLIYLGIFFKNSNLTFSKKWLKFAVSELHSEIEKQINTDGTTYETSTNYHRVVSELFLHNYLIGEKNNIIFNDFYKRKLVKMFEFMKIITKPNDYTPLIGDIDNGRLLIISDYFTWDKRMYNQLLNVASYSLNEPSLKEYSSLYSEDVLWLIGKRDEKEFCEEKVINHSLAFPEGGYYLLKNNRYYVIVRCGELSMRGQGGHSHNDQLSVEINVEGTDFVIDPGSYTYTGSVKLRNFDRSTRNHNTLGIEGIEQNDFAEDLFAMGEETFSTALKHNKNVFEGEHIGYEKKCGTKHKRTLNLTESNLIISDSLSYYDKNIKSFLVFILDPEVEILKKQGNIKLFSNNINLLTNISFDNSYIRETYISRGYGYRIKTKKIVIPISNDISTIFSIQ